LISIRAAHASRPRDARARNNFLQVLYITLRRTSHHSGKPRNFDTLVIRGACGAFPCLCMLLQTGKTQRVRNLLYRSAHSP
jgi:hypothetical protein